MIGSIRANAEQLRKQAAGWIEQLLVSPLFTTNLDMCLSLSALAHTEDTQQQHLDEERANDMLRILKGRPPACTLSAVVTKDVGEGDRWEAGRKDVIFIERGDIDGSMGAEES